MVNETPSWSAVYGRAGDVVAREIAGETILVPIRGDLARMQRIFTLNPVGACVWQGLDGVRTLGEVRDEVLERFDAAREEVEGDVREFVLDLGAAGLVREVG